MTPLGLVWSTTLRCAPLDACTRATAAGPKNPATTEAPTTIVTFPKLFINTVTALPSFFPNTESVAFDSSVSLISLPALSGFSVK
ncbi:wsv019 [White spot syndrome virus]|uniref:ICP35 n=4 Tax=White spot syndrome virus TaxID=342409 RepID=ICP35_WSSVS|nr:wsv019 [Shrimp white spot syndrome virus]Q8VBE2.1 RecName: Full=ICP35 [Shrimp white spot syndrome virus (isolate Tongan)]AFX59396.1 wsv019 [White spot syndrome virus]AAL33023.1 wsv019 [Shrimp white spot syndrome virus]AAL88943.1 WSSV075 [Shrimp white spot syndrome virus]AWQ60629.1 wsv019 [Shrimp white spot syndrome virus]AWQ61476.1 wsv019 [Shrimp white spot syndrome virus]